MEEQTMTSLRLCESNFNKLVKEHSGWKQRVFRTNIWEKDRVCASFEEGFIRMMTYEGLEICLVPVLHDYKDFASVMQTLYPTLFTKPFKLKK